MIRKLIFLNRSGQNVFFPLDLDKLISKFVSKHKQENPGIKLNMWWEII